MGEPIRIITRQSRLALIQVEELCRVLNQANSPQQLDFEVIKTESYGDRHKDVSLMDPALASDFFTRELDSALLEGRADIAVHSAKDLPYPLPAGIELIALTEGGEKTDSLVSRNNLTLTDLPTRSKVGTSSPQRKAELLALRPDLVIVPIRGTIEERISQVDSGLVDALIVATCALDRLGLSHRACQVLPFKTHPLQGNLAVTAKVGSYVSKLLKTIDIRPRFGKVTLVGFGPGDPDLLTIKGLRALENADVIFYDDLTNEEYLNRFRAQKIYVGKRSGKHSHHQDQINELIYQSAISGNKSVVRLKGGDPMIFAHGREEIDFLKSRFVEVEVIPGISSGNALASLTQIPLTHRGLARSVAFVLGHAEQTLTPDADTLIYYMGGAQISTIAQQLIKSGRKPGTPVALVANVSLPNQHEIYSTLEELRYAVYRTTPVLIVVGDVVGLVSAHNVSKTYNTGSQSDTPLIKITRNNIPLPEAKDFDWLVFTSRYGVRYYDKSLTDTKIASVGPVTTGEIEKRGYKPDFESATQSAEGLLEFFATQPKSKILLPRSNKGLKALSEGLAAQGHIVTDLPVYINERNLDAKVLQLSDFDKVVFSSPSAVEAFDEIYSQQDKKHLLLIAKGKTTYETFQTI